MSQGFDPFDPEEWGDKPGCSAFETALEMRERGALESSAVPVLDAHLEACDACRDHAARLSRVDASLAATAASPDTRRLRGKLDEALKRSRRTPWVVAGIGLIAGAATLWFFGGPLLGHPKWFLLTIPLPIVSGSLASYTHVIRLRRLLAEPDVVGAYRRWLEGSLKRMRWLPLVMAFYVPAIAFPMRSNWQRYAAGNGRAGLYVLMGIFGSVTLALSLIISRRQARRMAAELAQMN